MNQERFSLNQNHIDAHQAEGNQRSGISYVNQDEEAFFVVGAGADREVEVPDMQENVIMALAAQPWIQNQEIIAQVDVEANNEQLANMEASMNTDQAPEEQAPGDDVQLTMPQENQNQPIAQQASKKQNDQAVTNQTREDNGYEEQQTSQDQNIHGQNINLTHTAHK